MAAVYPAELQHQNHQEKGSVPGPVHLHRGPWLTDGFLCGEDPGPAGSLRPHTPSPQNKVLIHQLHRGVRAGRNQGGGDFQTGLAEGLKQKLESNQASPELQQFL